MIQSLQQPHSDKTIENQVSMAERKFGRGAAPIVSVRNRQLDRASRGLRTAPSLPQVQAADDPSARLEITVRMSVMGCSPRYLGASRASSSLTSRFFALPQRQAERRNLTIAQALSPT